MGKGKMDEGKGGDQFHRNEAISAVADESFLGEEDDDYEDLYSDVNVGEGFLQSLRRSDNVGFLNEVNKNSSNINSGGKFNGSAIGALESGVSIPGVAGGGDRGDSSVSYESQGFRSVSAVDDVKGPSLDVVGGGLRVEFAQASSKLNEVAVEQSGNKNNGLGSVGGMGHQGYGVGNVRGVENEGLVRQGVVGGAGVNGSGGSGGGPTIGNGGGNVGVAGAGPGVGANGGAAGGGRTILFVGDLHWWTTDTELESELCKYGPVKEVKFFDEKASGKSKGYCQVEFYDPAVATACKEGMNGHVFNGRPCVVAFASPFTVKKMGEAQLNRNQQMAQSALSQAKMGPNDVAGKTGANNIQTGGNYQGGDNNRGYGRGNWGRGNAQGMGGRGPDGPVRNRGGRGIMGNGGNGFGQGMGGSPPLIHPQSKMGYGFDPAFGGPMGRMGSYGGFPGAPVPFFSWILPSFPPVGGVGLPRMAPHVNPAFFGRGVPMNDMGMMPSGCVDGPNMGMLSDPSMGGWGGDEHGVGRAGESIYGEEAAADHQYGEVSHDKGGWQIQLKKKIEFLKESGLVHLKEGTVMIENQDMIGTYLGRRKWAMVMIGLKEGTGMIETLAENVIGSDLEIVTVIVIGNVIGIGIDIGIDIWKTETDKQIIVGTGTVRRSMMMIGTGGGRQGFTASPNYHRKMGIALDLEMLITGRGHGLPQGDLPEASYI